MTQKYDREFKLGGYPHGLGGVQYACTGFTECVTQHGFVQSMSRKGDCWDNAVAESFFHLLKTELTYRERWLDYRAAHRDLFEYIEVFYSREVTHSTLDYVPPTNSSSSYPQSPLKSIHFFEGVSLRSTTGGP